MELMNASVTLERIVTEDITASHVGSGNVLVLATPMMIALMEGAAAECLKPFLEKGQTSVGTYIATTHTAATPVGMKFAVTATVKAVNGKQIDFEVQALDEKGIIGEGRHTRVLLNQERFEQKALDKLK